MPTDPLSTGNGERRQRRYRVLIVDDERDFRHLMSMFLSRSAIPVDIEVAASGDDALRRVHNQRPDLILLDVMMPGMDGFEVCRRLRAQRETRAIPVVMLTSLDEVSDRTRGFSAGTDDYLGKPFDRGELLARVRRILERTYGYDGDAEPGIGERSAG